MPSILSANTLSSGFNVANSCRFNSGSSDNLQKTPSGDGNKTTFSVSTWVKRSKLGAAHESIWSAGQYQSTAMVQVFFESDDTIHVSQFNAGGGQQARLTTNRLFRDVSAWYHILAVWDTTNGTEANRLKLYVNGVQETSFSTAAYPSQNDNTGANTTDIPITIGNRQGHSLFFNGYQCECVLLDGTAATPTSFGEFDEDSGIWKPIDVSGLTFGTNGYYLDFEASDNLGNDANGGTDFSENNLTAVDQSTDTCTNNFATFNGSLKQMSTMALTEGNLQGATSSSHEAFFGSFFSSIGVTTGKWYAEFKCTGNANVVYVGISNNLEGDAAGNVTVGGLKAFTFAYKGNGWAYYGADGKIAHTNSNTFLSYGAALSNNDIVGVALDLDNLEIYFSVNGTFQNSGDPTSGASQTGGVVTAGGAALTSGANSGTYYFCVSDNDQSTVCTVQANFGSPVHSISSGNAYANGHGNFEYAVPSGYLAVCTKNLAESG